MPTKAVTHALAAIGGALLMSLGWWFWGSASSVDLSRPYPAQGVAGPASAWSTLPNADFPIPPFAEHLKGVRIVLDPGHGGRASKKGWKVGPTGLREAEVNLAVAQHLRDFLVAVGADVHMVRDGDYYLDPDISADNRQRVEMANGMNADLFLSLHHNGVESPTPNYTSVWYHGTPEHDSASRCAARYLLSGLNDTLRLDSHLPCGVLSDTLMGPRGFLVLREATVPAVLCEASFFTNPDEENRLRDPVYNRREAYGYFIGLARWAQAGLPRVALLEPDDGRVKAGGAVLIGLDDGLQGRGGWGSDRVRIAEDSIRVRVNERPVEFTADMKKGRLRVMLPRGLTGGTARVFVDFENTFGQHVLHPYLTVRITGR